MSLTLAHSDLTTCEISDALLKLGVPHGGHIPDIHRISPQLHPEGSAGIVRLCGPAYTVRIVLASERDEPKLQGGHFVDLAPEGSVAFVSAPPGLSIRRRLPRIPPLLPPPSMSVLVPAPLHITSRLTSNWSCSDQL
jgi:hypothetical protein